MNPVAPDNGPVPLPVTLAIVLILFAALVVAELCRYR